MSHRESSTTVVYVTHDQVEATTMADRIGVMSDGRLEQVGRTEQIYDRPANRFVAGFVGSPPMSFLEGRGEEGAFVAADVKVSLNGRAIAGPLVLGVRPHGVRLADAGTGDAHGEVQLLESLAGDTLVVVRVGGQLVRVLVRRADRPTEGTNVGLVLDRDEMHLFDASGTALS